MGYSMKDLENAGRNVNQHFEQKSQQRGEELAARLIHSTGQGRGLWFILLWPSWLLIFFFSGTFLVSGLEHLFGMSSPGSYLGYIGGFAFAVAWYRWKFTIAHPFWSTIIGYFGTALGVLLLVDKLGW